MENVDDKETEIHKALSALIDYLEFCRPRTEIHQLEVENCDGECVFGNVG